MNREIIITADGSHTVRVPEMGVTYHSLHGAVQESMHVFIEAGLMHLLSGPSKRPDNTDYWRIFEMGFGTGLNTLLTAIKASEEKAKIHYTTIDTFPLSTEEAALLNYGDALGQPVLFDNIHGSSWNEDVAITDYFTLRKIREDIINFSTSQLFNLVYYDAFAPSAQPELWTKEAFEKLYPMLQPGGFLVTYCSKSDVRRAMKAAGFSVEKLPGPRGKREMVRARTPVATHPADNT